MAYGSRKCAILGVICGVNSMSKDNAPTYNRCQTMTHGKALLEGAPLGEEVGGVRWS